MSSDTPPNPLGSKKRENSPLDPIAEFKRLKTESSEIAAKIRLSAPFLNPEANNNSKELLGPVLCELRMMTREMKEIKENGIENKKSLEEIKEKQTKLQEDVRGMKVEQESQKQALKDIGEMKIELIRIKSEQKKQRKTLDDMNYSLKEIKDIQTKLQHDVRKIQRKMLSELQNDGSNTSQSLVEVKTEQQQPGDELEIKNEFELSRESAIRRQIDGKWRDVQNQNWYFTAKFDKGQFLRKMSNEKRFTRYTLGEKHQDGWTTYIENNKIVQRMFSDAGKEIERKEFEYEDGSIVRTIFRNGVESSRRSFERAIEQRSEDESDSE